MALGVILQCRRQLKSHKPGYAWGWPRNRADDLRKALSLDEPGGAPTRSVKGSVGNRPPLRELGYLQKRRSHYLLLIGAFALSYLLNRRARHRK